MYIQQSKLEVIKKISPTIIFSTIMYMTFFVVMVYYVGTYYFISAGSETYYQVTISTSPNEYSSTTIYAALYFNTDTNKTCNIDYFAVPYDIFCLDAKYDQVCVYSLFNQNVNLRDLSCGDVIRLNSTIGTVPYSINDSIPILFNPYFALALTLLCLCIFLLNLLVHSLIRKYKICIPFPPYMLCASGVFTSFVLVIINFYGIVAYIFTNWVEFLYDVYFYDYFPDPAINYNFVQFVTLTGFIAFPSCIMLGSTSILTFGTSIFYFLFLNKKK